MMVLATRKHILCRISPQNYKPTVQYVAIVESESIFIMTCLNALPSPGGIEFSAAILEKGLLSNSDT